jgi:hypothetical protein
MPLPLIQFLGRGRKIWGRREVDNAALLKTFTLYPYEASQFSTPHNSQQLRHVIEVESIDMVTLSLGDEGGEHNGGEKVAGELVISGGDA